MTTTPLPPSEGWELDYDKLIADAFANHKYRQGTRECVAFKNGAHWAMQAYANAARADLETEVQRLKQAAEELSFLHGDLLLWTEWAVDKGNANSDLEDAWERYEEWLKARTALKETP